MVKKYEGKPQERKLRAQSRRKDKIDENINRVKFNFSL